MTVPAQKPARKLSMKQRYTALTHDLDWTPTYVTEDEIYPYTKFEGIKVHDWSKWEDPFRLTVEAYNKYQAEKDRRLYAVLDGFAQSQGQLGLTEARYMNAMKIFLQGIPIHEYDAHRMFSNCARYLNGPGARFAALCQSMDELRHAQTEIHTLSHYNKYFDGMHDWHKWSDRVWYLSVPKSFFEDAMTAGPFEWLIAIGFSFEYLLTNLLFVPFMSGAAFNGDLPTMTFGFSAQSDESRHMTLGLEAIKFMLEQDEDNLPIVQNWLDKWFWRGYRLISLVAGMMDYMLPRRVMSWKEAFELYFEEQMLNGLFKDLEYYGIKPPRDVQWAIDEKEILSHQVYWILYQFSHAAAFTTTIPNEDDQAWLMEAYPETWPIFKSAVWDKAQRVVDSGGRFFNPGLPQLCTTCQIPMGFTEPGNPLVQCQRESVYEGERYDFCSDGCKTIFDNEPVKYRQSWLPVHQIFQGNCGGPGGLPAVAAWYGLQPGDGGEYLGSPDNLNWLAWHGQAAKEA